MSEKYNNWLTEPSDEIQEEMKETLDRISAEIKANQDHATLLFGSMDVVEKIRVKALKQIAEARSTLLAEVLAVVDERIAHNDDVWRNGAHIQDNAKALERKRELNTIRARLAALNQTENDDE